MYEQIKRIFKALNSSQAPWQLSLALALSVIPGLTPVMSPHNLLILLLAFFLNINLGLFFMGVGVFSGCAYLLDPLFDTLGFAVLHSAPLQDLWTAWYNNPWMRLSHFNNSLVMGSLIVSLAAAVPLFFIFQFLIRHYRDRLVRLFEKVPLLKAARLFDWKEGEGIA